MVEAVHHFHAQLVQRREWQLHLRLDADRAHNGESLRRRCGVIEQCGLADPGSPRSTSARLLPARTSARNSSSTAHSRLRPGSIEDGVRPRGSIVFIADPTDAKTS